jgi:fibronectin type 3 domain-containing protein
MINRILIVLTLSLLSYAVNGQSKKPTVLYAKPYKDSIALRWQLYDAKLWESNIRRGYDVYRKSTGGQVTKINDKTIKAIVPQELPMRYVQFPKMVDTTKADWENSPYPDTSHMTYPYHPDTMAFKANALQFPLEVGFDASVPKYKEGDFLDFGDDPLEIRWLFHSILCLSSKEATVTSGLYFLDKKVDRKERYTYYLCTAGEGIDKALASVTLSSMDPYLIHAANRFSDFTNKKRSVVTWKKTDTTHVYIPVYDIFRSEKKTGPYIKMNEKAILAVYTGASQRDSTIVTYDDHTLEKEKVYYYKVRGMDVFGDYSPLSEPWKVTEKTLIEMAPYIEEATKVTNPFFGASIRWKVEATEEKNIAFFRIYKSSNPDSFYVPLPEIFKKEDRSFVDKKPIKNNYYKLMTVGKAGDTLWTTPSYVMIPDSIPPAPAIMLKAICDSLGIVTITWKHNKEPDLKSFKLYRSNYSHEEFSRVATIERIDTIYRDTISLKTLTEQVYYKILAYDDSYNPSEFSNVIKAKRYDIIPPNHPVFTSLRSDSTGIRLTWGNSSSTDVIKTVLYRKLKGEISWHDYKTYARDTAKYTSFTDTNTYKGQWYEYTMRCFDDDKLISEYAPIAQLRAFDDGFRPAIQKISSKINVKKHTVKLEWTYPQSGVEHFQIYKAKNQEKMSILISLKPGVFECYDKEVGSGNQYRYLIKAVFKDGGESPFSKEIVVQF